MFLLFLVSVYLGVSDDGGDPFLGGSYRRIIQCWGYMRGTPGSGNAVSFLINFGQNVYIRCEQDVPTQNLQARWPALCVCFTLQHLHP